MDTYEAIRSCIDYANNSFLTIMSNPDLEYGRINWELYYDDKDPIKAKIEVNSVRKLFHMKEAVNRLYNVYVVYDNISETTKLIKSKHTKLYYINVPLSYITLLSDIDDKWYQEHDELFRNIVRAMVNAYIGQTTPDLNFIVVVHDSEDGIRGLESLEDISNELKCGIGGAKI